MGVPRTARIFLPDLPHHITQRGNRRGPTFFHPSDYAAYLELAAREFTKQNVAVWAYCLMPNHVHLIVAASDPAAISSAVGRTHQQYTHRINLREGWRGHLWQGRFASFAMDEAHLRRCIRYVGLNPVRAGLVQKAAYWPWSSIRAHVEGIPDPLLTPGPVAERLQFDLATFFDQDLSDDDLLLFRRATALERPLITSGASMA